MDKNQIFAQVKSDMEKLLSDLTLENVFERKPVFCNYLAFLETLQSLPSDEKEEVSAAPAESSASQKEEQASFSEKEVQENPSLVFGKTDRFVRGLRHGQLPNLGNLFVPEREIRNHGFDHGDLIRIVEKRNDKWIYALEKKAEPNPSFGRREILHCKVELHQGEHVIRTSYSADLSGKHLVVPPSDVPKFGIREGSVVDVAYWESKPDQILVTWQHKDYDRQSFDGQKFKTPVSVMKLETDAEQAAEMANSLQPSAALQGRKILLLGSESNKAAFKAAVESRGGAFSWLSGEESKTSLSAKIRSSDTIVMVPGHMSEEGFYNAAEVCKNHAKPFSVVDSPSVPKLMDAALSPHTVPYPAKAL